VSQENLITELKGKIQQYYVELAEGKVVFKKPEVIKEDK